MSLSFGKSLDPLSDFDDESFPVVLEVLGGLVVQRVVEVEEVAEES